jgi:hypothetical protein
MRKYCLFPGLLLMILQLSAFQVYLPEGQVKEITVEDLKQEKLVTFTTVRDKDGGQKEESWQGIPLISWLNSLTGSSWQNLQIESNDNYQLSFHRLELDDTNAYLALKLGAEELSDYNIRLIFTRYRENAWMRNIKCLRMLGFKPVPKPRQIYFWDNALQKNGIDLKSGAIAIKDLMQKGFGLESGDLIFVDEQLRKLCLNYPREIANASLFMDSRGQYFLVPEPSSPLKISFENDLSRIIYIQCGAIAYLPEDAIENIAGIGKTLNWNWNSEYLYFFRAEKRQIKTGEKPSDINEDCWLEF